MKLYRAVVENNNDEELKLGRVKVRIHGLHTKNNENEGSFNSISKEDLPWAQVMGGNSFGLVSGIGVSSVLRQGTWVWVMLEEDNPNKPIVIGTIIGAHETKEAYADGIGFTDPDAVYPYNARLTETDINRLARNEKLGDPSYDTARSVYGSTDTIHKQINDNVDVQTSITDSITGADVSQTEPNSLNDASEYPNVNIIETHSGHVLELDDTSGNERIRVYHTSGSYIEIRPDGTFVQKCVNTDSESHYIHMSDVHEHIAKGVKRYIEANLEEIIGQNFLQNIKGNLKLHVEGNLDWQVDGNVTFAIGGNQSTSVSGKTDHATNGDTTVTAANIYLN